MIITDGKLFFSSTKIDVVGDYTRKSVSVYIQGLDGKKELNFESPERSCAIHMRMVLEITPREEIKAMTDYLFSVAKSRGLVIEKVMECFNEIINQKGGKNG